MSEGYLDGMSLSETNPRLAGRQGLRPRVAVIGFALVLSVSGTAALINTEPVITSLLFRSEAVPASPPIPVSRPDPIVTPMPVPAVLGVRLHHLALQQATTALARSMAANLQIRRATALADAEATTTVPPKPARQLAALESPAPIPMSRPRQLAAPAPDQLVPFAAEPVTTQPTAPSQMRERAVALNPPRPAPALARPQAPRPARFELAYANVNDPARETGGAAADLQREFGHAPRLPGPGSGIAVYDIKAATVYMPDGEKLEAHSGLGYMRDKPRYAHEKNRGPTPPNVYKLVMRKQRFHGVQAVRMLPVDGKLKYGRDGFLAHTYMLRGTSQSNGCVVFKDYQRFLSAFKRGKITKMVVVPDLSDLPTMIASL